MADLNLDIDTNVNADIDLELDIDPIVQVELDAEPELEIEAPVQVQLDAALEVEIEVEVPQAEVQLEIQMPAEVEVQMPVEIEVDQPLEVVTYDAQVEMDIEYEVGGNLDEPINAEHTYIQPLAKHVTKSFRCDCLQNSSATLLIIFWIACFLVLIFGVVCGCMVRTGDVTKYSQWRVGVWLSCFVFLLLCVPATLFSMIWYNKKMNEPDPVQERFDLGLDATVQADVTLDLHVK